MSASPAIPTLPVPVREDFNAQGVTQNYVGTASDTNLSHVPSFWLPHKSQDTAASARPSASRIVCLAAVEAREVQPTVVVEVAGHDGFGQGLAWWV